MSIKVTDFHIFYKIHAANINFLRYTDYNSHFFTTIFDI